MAYYFRAKQLCVGYQNQPLIQNIEIELKKGEILTLIGPNGAGKSTILKSIARQLELLGGSVLLEDKNLQSLSGRELAKKMAVVFTKRPHTELMTCEDVVATGRYPYTGRFGVLSAKDHEAVQEAMEAVHVLEFKDRDFARISDGQRQRILLARAICQQPEILLLDEPTAGLDPKGRDDILDQIAALHKMRGITIILVSHSMEDIAKYVERLIVMNHGEMVFDDTPKNVFSHYKELEGMGLAAPQITYIMHALSENGLNVDTTATTVEEARDTILEALKKQKPSLLKKGGRSE